LKLDCVNEEVCSFGWVEVEVDGLEGLSVECDYAIVRDVDAVEF
jgi:hypothetical protein